MKSALWIPLFDELADPRVVMRLAAEAEELGWHGVFVWDHMRWGGPVSGVGDPLVTLTAAATATSAVRLGPMVTPLARRRPARVARETASLDALSEGRLVLGVGLGSDRFGGEFSRFGEEVDDRRRAEMLDEGLAILRAAWTGEAVDHEGEHYVVRDVSFLPRPIQPTLPVWVAGFSGNPAPLRRASRHDGFIPLGLAEPDALAEVVAAIEELRDHRKPQPDVVAAVTADDDLGSWESAGATWWLTHFEVPPHIVTVDEVRGVLRNGPYRAD